MRMLANCCLMLWILGRCLHLRVSLYHRERERLELLLPREFVATTAKATATGVVSFLLYSSFIFFVFWVSSRNFKTKSMAARDTFQVIESILDEEYLVRIQEEFNISISIRLELPSPSKRVNTGLMRHSLPIIIIELLRWY